MSRFFPIPVAYRWRQKLNKIDGEDVEPVVPVVPVVPICRVKVKN